MPAGSYIVEIKAIGSNGTMVKATTPVLLVR
jgi:hypothetical protein